jgi:type VI secretion system protein VasD
LAALCCLVAALATGCASAPKPARLDGIVVASPGLNPSVSRRPSPLLVRIYELRSATTFNQVDFMSLYEGDQATLGADMVQRDEIVLQPGETRPYVRQLDPQTRFVGVFAAYRDLEHAIWRVVVPIKPGKANKVTLNAEGLKISAQVEP